MAAAGAPAAGEDGGGILHSLTARGESLAAFDGRCIPAGCVAPRSNTPGILGRRALPAGRLARLGATPDFHHGLLTRCGPCLRRDGLETVPYRFLAPCAGLAPPRVSGTKRSCAGIF